jgi:hypothetical protein
MENDPTLTTLTVADSDHSGFAVSRPFVISAAIALIFVTALQAPDIKDFLWVHPWWRAFLAALPLIVLTAVGIIVQSRLSRDSDGLRTKANGLQAKANELQDQLDTERNQHLQQIARNTEREVTPAERNAATLRTHLRARVSVTEGTGYWPSSPEIAEISEDNIATFFSPRSPSSSSAWCIKVRCGDLEITDIPDGACPIRVTILRRYGSTVQLGEITRWEDRLQPTATPVFAKGDCVYHSAYVKIGSSEKRSLAIHASTGGENSFLLVSSTGETAVGDNIEISKRFMIKHIEYLAAGFTRNMAGSGSSKYPLFVSTN